MSDIIGVRFKAGGKIYYFSPNEEEFALGDGVVVETARGLECGEIALEKRTIPDEQIPFQLKPVVRKATEEDLRRVEENRKREVTAFDTCVKRIAKHKLDMKLVSVEYAFDGSKILFCFTADGRVDFRELVKDLAGIFRTRIELRQIGVRDEARMLGGLGICGRPFCCATFLSDFQPVSIKMAKEQGLSLNPVKISGTCGRLMCCLKYEQAAYDDLLKITPKIGASVLTPEGRGTVIDRNVITGSLRVQLEGENQGAPKTYNIKQCRLTSQRKQGEGDALTQEEMAQIAELAALEEPTGSKSLLDDYALGAAPSPAEEIREKPARQQKNNQQRGNRSGKPRGDNQRANGNEKSSRNNQQRGGQGSRQAKGNGGNNAANPESSAPETEQKPSNASGNGSQGNGGQGNKNGSNRNRNNYNRRRGKGGGNRPQGDKPQGERAQSGAKPAHNSAPTSGNAGEK